MKNSERDFDEGEMDAAEANDLVFESDDEGDVTFVDSSGSCLSSDEESDLDRRILGEISDDDDREESTAADGCAHATDRCASDEECGAELALRECQDNRADTVSSGSCSVSAVSQSIPHRPSSSSSSSSSDSDQAEESTPRRRANPVRRVTAARGAGRRGGRGAARSRERGRGNAQASRSASTAATADDDGWQQVDAMPCIPEFKPDREPGLDIPDNFVTRNEPSFFSLFLSPAILTTLADLTKGSSDIIDSFPLTYAFCIDLTRNTIFFLTISCTIETD